MVNSLENSKWIFMFVMAALGATASAQEAPIAQDAFPIARVSITVSSSDSNRLKQYCLDKVGQAIDHVIAKLKHVDHPLIVDGDPLKVCKRILIISRPIKNSSNTSVNFGNIFWRGQNVFDTTYLGAGGEVVAVCEPRDYDEELFYVAAARCRKQMTEDCLTPEFRAQVKQLGRTQLVNTVDAEKTCETNSVGSSVQNYN